MFDQVLVLVLHFTLPVISAHRASVGWRGRRGHFASLASHRSVAFEVLVLDLHLDLDTIDVSLTVDVFALHLTVIAPSAFASATLASNALEVTSFGESVHLEVDEITSVFNILAFPFVSTHRAHRSLGASIRASPEVHAAAVVVLAREHASVALLRTFMLRAIISAFVGLTALRALATVLTALRVFTTVTTALRALAIFAHHAVTLEVLVFDIGLDLHDNAVLFVVAGFLAVFTASVVTAFRSFRAAVVSAVFTALGAAPAIVTAVAFTALWKGNASPRFVTIATAVPGVFTALRALATVLTWLRALATVLTALRALAVFAHHAVTLHVFVLDVSLDLNTDGIFFAVAGFLALFAVWVVTSFRALRAVFVPAVLTAFRAAPTVVRALVTAFGTAPAVFTAIVPAVFTTFGAAPAVFTAVTFTALVAAFRAAPSVFTAVVPAVFTALRAAPTVVRALVAAFRAAPAAIRALVTALRAFVTALRAATGEAPGVFRVWTAIVTAFRAVGMALGAAVAVLAFHAFALHVLVFDVGFHLHNNGVVLAVTGFFHVAVFWAVVSAFRALGAAFSAVVAATALRAAITASRKAPRVIAAAIITAFRAVTTTALGAAVAVLTHHAVTLEVLVFDIGIHLNADCIVFTVSCLCLHRTLWQWPMAAIAAVPAVIPGA